MCQSWSASFQRGMHFHLRPNISVLLMSRRSNAPYRDHVEDDGRVLIYEGHDVSKTASTPEPKALDQPRAIPSGKLTQNGLFERAAMKTKSGHSPPELVAVYEKIHAGIWAFNGFFHLTDSCQVSDGRRTVFKFRLELAEGSELEENPSGLLPNTRIIPSIVKQEVWKRDAGKCVICGAIDNLHFDHDIPFSKGGSSLVAHNIRLLCARHNLAKSDKIQ